MELIEQIHGWNRRAGVIETDNRQLESTMLLEEVLEGMGIPNAKETSRKLVTKWLDEYPDRVDVTDADWLDHLCDIEFILHGSKSKIGLPPEQDVESLQIVANANDAKLASKASLDTTGKVTKPKDFKGPEEALKALLERRAKPQPTLLDEES